MCWRTVEENRDSLISSSELAHLLSISETTVRRWVRETDIPHVDISSREGRVQCRFDLGKVLRWLNDLGPKRDRIEARMRREK